MDMIFHFNSKLYFCKLSHLKRFIGKLNKYCFTKIASLSIHTSLWSVELHRSVVKREHNSLIYLTSTNITTID